MSQNFTAMHTLNHAPCGSDWVFAYDDQDVLLLDGNIPCWDDVKSYFNHQGGFYVFGKYQNRSCVLIDNASALISNIKSNNCFLSKDNDAGKSHMCDSQESILADSIENNNIFGVGSRLDGGRWFEARLLKRQFDLLGDDVFGVACLGKHLQHWRLSVRYCGHCGSKACDVSHERAMQCSSCKHVFYPRVAPCIIVLITRGEEMLLARSPHFAPGMFSTLAGYIEPGENVEDAVHREVFEEVGVKIHNLKYIESQPWPFPDSLMLGFTAEYLSGEIAIDGVEIESAGWFTKDTMPARPPSASIASKLINYHINKS